MARREASQLNNTHPGVVTTTVFTYPTITSAAPQTSRGTILVAAIVGGVIAGMLLAIILTAGWVCWGKSIKRTEAKQRSEAVSPSCHTHNKDKVFLSSPSRKHSTKRSTIRFITLQLRSLEYRHINHSSLVLQGKRLDSRATTMEKWGMEMWGMEMSMIGDQKYHCRHWSIRRRLLRFLLLQLWSQRGQNRSCCVR